MKIVGVDLSMRSTGLAAILLGDRPGGVIEVDTIQTKPEPGDESLHGRDRRLRNIRDGVTDWCTGAALVVIEGPAFASASPHSHERSGLWWMVVDALLAREHQVVVVAPAARAKYATGKGNAGKDQVLAAVVRRYPHADVQGNDEADSLVLAAMGARALGNPVDDVPQVNASALLKVAWPEPAEVVG